MNSSRRMSSKLLTTSHNLIEAWLTTVNRFVVEYAHFLHLPGQRFDDFDDIRREIERQTDRLCGGNKGIMDKPISLTIYSPHGRCKTSRRLLPPFHTISRNDVIGSAAAHCFSVPSTQYCYTPLRSAACHSLPCGTIHDSNTRWTCRYQQHTLLYMVFQS